MGIRSGLNHISVLHSVHAVCPTSGSRTSGFVSQPAVIYPFNASTHTKKKNAPMLTTLPPSHRHPPTYIPTSFNGIPHYGESRRDQGRKVSPSRFHLAFFRLICSHSPAGHATEKGPSPSPAEGDRSHRKEAVRYNRGFVEKRNDDLSITLIVVSSASCVLRPHALIGGGQASLFSAVISAFIIYVQPQLQSNSEDETAALLRVLLYKTDNTTFGGDVPQLPQWTGPPPTLVATQALLYLSLVATLASVLFAILAKQLLGLYILADEWEVNEGNRSERRRLKWFTLGLHTVVLALSFLLQFALILLGCAMTIYLWKINIVIASIILAATLCIVPVYGLFGILAMINFGLSNLRTMAGLIPSSNDAASQTSTSVKP